MADIIGLDGKRAEKEKEKPTPRWFQIVLREDPSGQKEVIEDYGFLLVSPAFIGIVNEEDKVQVMVPSENILYVRDTNDEQEETEG